MARGRAKKSAATGRNQIEAFGADASSQQPATHSSAQRGKAGQRRTAQTGAPAASVKREDDYRHSAAEVLLRPDVGTQAQFRKKKPPVNYRYDSSLSPALDWDNNPTREQGETSIREILELDAAAIDAASGLDDAKDAGRAALAKAKRTAEKLKHLGAPFLNWCGKAERLSFDVPTLPLFIHERLSTKAIIETLKSHEKRKSQTDMFNLFGDPNRSVADQVLRAYEYKDEWVNRLILGDSLIVMNSLLNYENMGCQVQMIYIDPPYGVKFGSNFQPFVRKRDVSNNDDDDMTREPEMVKAYRDTWELGLHSYLTYLRDRLLLARDLLHVSGSVFVQISDDNIHHVRELLDETFGSENFVALIPFRKKTMPMGTKLLEQMADYLLWYAKSKEVVKYRQLFVGKDNEGDPNYRWYEDDAGNRHEMNRDEIGNRALIPKGVRVFTLKSLEPSGRMESGMFDYAFEGRIYPHPANGYGTTPAGMDRLRDANRLMPAGTYLRYVLYEDDYPVSALTNPWHDTSWSGFGEQKLYVVQTNSQVVRRCMLMTTDPGDLVVDPTCGSGTTAYAAEQWGRRWITIDTSRVPLALTRQRLLTATFPYYELKQEQRGPVGGFVYARRQNKSGAEVGGIIPHITLGSIANGEPTQEEVLFDRPEVALNIVRVTGPFTVEATIPSPVDLDVASDNEKVSASDDHAPYVERMLEVLRKSPIVHVGGGKTVKLSQIRVPAKSLALSAEAVVDGNGGTLQSVIDAAHETNTGGLRFSQRPAAILFGPENAAVSEKLVYEAAREAHAKNFTHLYVIGFAIQPNARNLIENCEAAVGIAATYVQATPDLAIGDLLKTTRASQIFSVCGMPEIQVEKVKPDKHGDPARYSVRLLGLDVFDPATMELEHKAGDDVPAWLLDTDYNGLVFHGSQVFFPRTAAWDALKKALRATHEESVWDHLAGTQSAPFEAGEHGQIAVKVIDDRGNELLVVKSLKDAVQGGR